MKNKKIYLLALMLLICILSISAISATENTANKDVISANNNKETNLETDIQYDDVSNSKENVELNLEENKNNDKEGQSQTDETTTEPNAELSFTDLNTTINGNTNSTIYLSNNYKYNSASDNNFKLGITINRNLTVYGNGVTIDGNNIARIFNVTESKFKVNFYNITFINGNASNGGAIYQGNAYNCTFTNNKAIRYGSVFGLGYAGALYKGNAYNCTFTNNYATEYGGAMYQGEAYNCTFTKNIGVHGGAIYTGKAYYCNFTENYVKSGGSGGAIANVNAYYCNFIGNYINITKTGATGGGAISNGNAYNCNFTRNYAPHGGAISQGNAYNCTFTNNNATRRSGAISSGNAYNCTFTNNTAPEGGAKYGYYDAYNCTFIGNNATNGGAISGGKIYNCTFIGNTATNGGAISGGKIYNCTFIGNTATNGGAIYGKNTFAFNCTFHGNNATQEGGAMYNVTSLFCTFNGDTTYNTTIIPAIINVLNYTSHYGSGEKLKFNLTANDTLYDGFNTTIKIYKDGSLVKTVYGLTGEGWIVDLDGGKYIAELSLTDYPEEQPSNATITVKVDLTFTELNTIINNNTNSTIYLSDDFKFNSASDNDFKNGIPISRNLTIYGNGATIDGNYIARIFNVTDSNLNVKFYNINFINGFSGDGGAIYGGDAYNCTFTGNKAFDYGGAIYRGNATNCTFKNNNATNGGAISSGNAYNCTFTQNIAEAGGAIHFSNAYNCTFTQNIAEYGGAIFWGNITNCTFTQNIAEYGGAISQGNTYNCTFTGNNATNGGAIYGGDAYNCTFHGNNATENGGAIEYCDAYNCTFTNNTAKSCGGAIGQGNAYNCSFSGNNATNGGAMYEINAYNCTFHGNNATENGGAMYQGTSLFSTFNGDTTYNTTIIPAIINVSNYSSSYGSGKKLEFNLTANGTVYNGFNTTIEIYQNGTLLKTVYALTGEGWTVDLDYGNYTAVLKLTDYPDEPSSNVTITIKDSLTFTDLNTTINNNTNSTIYLSNNYTYDNTSDNNFKSGIPISRNLTIYGNGITVDGNNLARIFNVTDPNLNVKFYNINFINGNSENGGAIYQGDAYNCNFTGNTATEYGGAIYQGDAYNCTFTQNNASYGGAIWSGNASNCTFTENKALYEGGALIGNAFYCTFTQNNGNNGGAICRGRAYNSTFTENNGTNGGAVSIGETYDCTFIGNNANNGGALHEVNAYNCTFTNNNATIDGGAIYYGNASNCIFTGNNATENGGAMYGGNAYNSTFTDNTATNGGAIYGTYAFNSTFHGNNATENGGAMYQGTSLFSTFNGDTTYNTTIIPAIINVSNYSSTYESGKKLEFNLTANGTVYNGFNTTIEIYQNGTLLKTVYALTGEGWTVDLDYGNYTAVLKLTDYPDEPSSNVTITIKDSLTFTDLNTTINNNTNSTIYLSGNFKYDSALDNDFKNGIPISRNLTIYGNGATIDGNYIARIFNVTDSNLNVNFYNINFINGNATNGGAIYRGNAYYCNFTGNHANSYDSSSGEGGAIYLGNAYYCNFTENYISTTSYLTSGGAIGQGNAYNCTFTGNYGPRGGAIGQGNAYNCTFTQNNAQEGGALYKSQAYDCTFTNNNASNYGGAMEDGHAYNCTFTNNNATERGGAIYDVNAYNCTFTQNNATNGGAIYGSNAYNCTFTQNNATNGGAIYKAYVFNSTFNGNNATQEGGAMYNGTSLFCTFNGDTTYNSTIIPAIINVSNYSSSYGSGKKLEFNLTANGTVYNGFNTTIEIYQNGTLLKTVYALTGEGWTVDLDYGNYTAVLKLTDYPDEPSSNVTITIKDSLTFTDLNTTINNNTNSTIYLSNNYTYDNTSDNNFKSGIPISRNLTIYGNGITVDGNNLARIFNVTDPNLNVKFYNINFINGNSENGGAIYQGDAYNCTFTQNNANNGGAICRGRAYNSTFTENNGTNGGAVSIGETYDCTFIGNNANNGGALHEVNAYNCTFKNNTATTGQAMYEGNSLFCTFNGDTTYNTTIIPAIINVSNYSSTYESGKKLEFNLTANGTLYNGFNTTIEIYQNGTLLKTVYGLTGQGWTVDLDYGTYTAVLSLTEYPDEPSSNATIAIKEEPSIVITPITNATIGQEITINISTNSNGTVTIKVNNQTITGNKFTPEKPGTYNITVEIAETEYYAGASNETSFTIPKTNTTVEISPITNVTLGEEVNINVTTNSNGTVTIKINNQTIHGTKFTPEKPGTYNITVEIAENDYYEGATNETTFTIPKTNTTVEISPITNVVIGEEITINYTTNSNGTVTIQVNGTPVTDGKFTPNTLGIYNLTIEIAENEYYTGATQETTFTAKNNTTVVIAPIGDVVVGEEITINYTTNSNGTVTIKVNNQTITGNKFTPEKPGTYNITVEIAETEYYAGASNETSFTIPKTNTTVEISPITNVTLGEEVNINVTTNSNGTVTIKINNQTIHGTKFTPEKPGTYNITVEIAENDYYTGAIYETTFKVVGKLATKIKAKPVTTTYYMSKIFTITLKDANGKPIRGAILTVKLDGTKKYKTNKNGQVKIQVGALTPKTYNVKITYAGSKKYKATTTSVKIPIKKATPKITAYTVKYNGKNKQFKVYFLTDHMKYHALKNKEVTLKVNGKTYTVKTNKKGQGIFNINHLKKGKYTAVLTVPANQYYNKVTKKVIITVKK